MIHYVPISVLSGLSTFSSCFSMSWSGVRSHGWIHDVCDVWMNRWVLKKLSKDVFDGLAEYVKNMAKKFNICMYVFLM